MKKRHIVWIVLVILIIFIGLARTSLHSPSLTIATTRLPAVAGSWYPGDRNTLNKTVSDYLSKADNLGLGTVKAIIVPHAGYEYSGQVAAFAFKQLANDYDNVIVLGTSHHFPLVGASTVNYTYYNTPLGNLKVNQIPGIPVRNDVDKPEHSIEMELPFLQTILGSFELAPVIVGRVQPVDFVKTLEANIDERALLVVSVDMSHYHPYEEALKLDNSTINNILSLNANDIFSNEIDSPWAVSTLLLLAKENGWTPHLAKYANSGDVTGDRSSVVGYSAIVFTEQTGFTEQEHAFLLDLARKTLQSKLAGGTLQTVDESKLSPALLKEQGCFVTLNEKGRLRGCIGHILPQEALYKCVMDNALNAALHDSRFNPVAEDELKDIQIEISVLSIPQQLDFSGPEDLKSRLVPLRDGVVLESGWQGATYLPQVWEDLPDKEEFLSSLCEKGGAVADCWKDDSTKVYTYQAEVFSEK
ncbi:MAG: AmmeMemoRadiSam system protein B [Candidatus Woesearchaeota archaeon]